MEELQINHPDLVEVTEIGRSFEGRPLLVIKVNAFKLKTTLFDRLHAIGFLCRPM